MVGDDLVAVGRGEFLPACVRGRGEPGDGVVEVADEAGGAAELGVIAGCSLNGYLRLVPPRRTAC